MIVRSSRLLILAALAAAAPPVRAQTDDAPTTVNSTAFSFDFSAPPSEAAELQEVQLYFSVDRGRNWRLYRGVPPSDGKITFEAAGEGEYWFAVQQVYKDGRRRPARMENATPQRKVIVDTSAPRVDLRPLSGDGKIGVEWTIRGDDVDLNSLRLESRPLGKKEWSPIALSPTRTGRKTWEPTSTGDAEVRLRVLDQAGNEAAPNVFVNPTRSVASGMAAVDDGRGFSEPPRPGGIEGGGRNRNEATLANRGGRLVAEGDAPVAKPTTPGATSSVQTFYVNHTRFKIDYKLDRLGKSGCKAVHLFWRHPDENEWQDYGANAGTEPPFKVAVTGEGKYGIRLRAVSGVGLSEEMPSPGAPPQLWVVVDVTPPSVQLDAPRVRFADKPEVILSWRAKDDNPGGNKVRLSYAALDGADASKWKEIAKGLKDEGEYRWKPPEDAPYRFHVRAEAEDAAGNTGHEDTVEPVSIDDSRPRAIAIKVEAIGEGDSPTKPVSAPVKETRAPSSRGGSSDDDDLAPAVEIGKKAHQRGDSSPPPPLPNKPRFP